MPVTMLDSDGNRIIVQDDKIADAISYGFHLETPTEQTKRVYSDVLEDEYGGASGAVTAGALGVARGATLGLSDVAFRALGADPQALRRYEEANPNISTGASLLGGLAPALVAPESLLGRLPAGALSRVAATGVEAGRAAGGVGGIATALTASGIEGAGQVGGAYLSDLALGKRELSAEGVAASLGSGFLLGAAGGGVALGIEQGSIAARRMFSRVADGGPRAATEAEQAWATQLQATTEAHDAAVDAAVARVQQKKIGTTTSIGTDQADVFTEKTDLEWLVEEQRKARQELEDLLRKIEQPDFVITPSPTQGVPVGEFSRHGVGGVKTPEQLAADAVVAPTSPSSATAVLRKPQQQKTEEYLRVRQNELDKLFSSVDEGSEEYKLLAREWDENAVELRKFRDGQASSEPQIKQAIPEPTPTPEIIQSKAGISEDPQFSLIRKKPSAFDESANDFSTSVWHTTGEVKAFNGNEFSSFQNKLDEILSPQEKDAVYGYSTYRAYTINNDLRSSNLTPHSEKYIKFIDSAMNKSSLPNNVRVFRGIGKDTEIRNVLENVNPGDELLDLGYMSTSATPEIARGFANERDFGGAIMVIDVPRGNRGIAISGESSMERELLLPRGTKLKVISTEIKGGGINDLGDAIEPERVVHLQVVQDVSTPRFKVIDREAGGTQGGRWYNDTNGNNWFGKDYSGSTDRAEVEYIANRIYKEFDVPVPDAIIEDLNGKKTFLSKEIVGKLPSSVKDLKSTNAKNGFVIDAWLGNWDVLGQDLDNIIVSGKNAYRIDNGGSLIYRAMGEEKKFTAPVIEIDTMRDASKSAGRVFKSLSNDEIKVQIADFVKRYDERKSVIEKMIAESGLSDDAKEKIRSGLRDRAEWLRQRVSAPTQSLTGQLRETSKRLAAGESIGEIGAASRAEPKGKAFRERSAPVDIGQLEVQQDAALNKAASAADPAERAAAISEANRIEAQITAVGKLSSAPRDIDVVAPAITKYERKSAELVEALGDDAPPMAREHAKTFRDAETVADRKMVDRTTVAVDDSVESFGKKKGKTKSKASQDEPSLPTASPASSLPVATPTRPLRPTLGALGTAAAVVGVAGELGIPGIPKPHDIPVIGPLLSAYIKYRAIKATVGRFTGRVSATGDTRAAVLVARIKDKLATAVDKSLGLVAEAAPKARGPIVVSASVIGKRIFDDGEPDAPKDATRQEQAAVRVREIVTAATQPELVSAMVRSEMRGVADPDLIAAAEQHLIARFSYLASVVPKPPPDNAYAMRPWVPSAAATHELDQRLRVIHDPSYAINGTVTPVTAETFRKVHPQLYELAKNRLISRLGDISKPIDYNERLRASMLFQMPVDASLDPMHISIVRTPGIDVATPTPRAAASFNVSGMYTPENNRVQP